MSIPERNLEHVLEHDKQVLCEGSSKVVKSWASGHFGWAVRKLRHAFKGLHLLSFENSVSATLTERKSDIESAFCRITRKPTGKPRLLCPAVG